MERNPDRSELYSGLVWIISALSLVTYAGLALTKQALPGVEELVAFISTVEGTYIFAAAFTAVLIEGLYVVGSFFPGTTMITLVAILSQASGAGTFVGTIVAIYLGWVLAGAINIAVATMYRRNALGQVDKESFAVKDRLFVTWFPAFRANYEVSQIAAGGNPWQVFLSSLRVKTIVSLGMLIVMYSVPFFYDVQETSNEEGFLSLFVVATISCTVGVIKIRSYLVSCREVLPE